MARIRPFRGIRPRPELAAEIASPPYDVLDRQEVLSLLERQPKSFMRVIRSDVFFETSIDAKDQSIYDKGRAALTEMIDQGQLVRDERPALYLYQQIMGEHSQLGLVVGASIDEYFAGAIKKHEHTRNKDLDGRIRHIETLGVNAGPVFLTYYADAAVGQLMTEYTQGAPAVEFVADDEVRHRLWVIDEIPKIEALQAAFEAVPALYIADGHHRTEAGCQVGRRRAEANAAHRGDEAYNDIMAVVFPHDQVQILAYNRVVHDLDGKSPEELIAALDKHFTCEATESPQPEEPASFGMYLAGRWYRLRARPDSYDASDRQSALDVAILQNNILGPLLGIDDPKKSQRIEFVGGIRGAKELERRAGKDGVAFYCYPTQMQQVMEISDAAEVMPPKSTWFEPKLRSGMVVKSLND